MELPVPERLRSACRQAPEGPEWLQRLPHAVNELRERWSLTLGTVHADASCAWVVSVTAMDRVPAVLKLGLPHMEGRDEAHGLRFWNGEPTAQLLAMDEALDAMLIERCEPGTSLRAVPEHDQTEIIAGLLRCLWRSPATPHPFRPLSTMLEYWSAETLAAEVRWTDAGLVREGLRLFAELPRTASEQMLLATDLHAGNVLRAQRKPWLVIDPKPFVGDPAYDLTQHLLNPPAVLSLANGQTIDRMADLTGVDPARVRRWIFARAAAQPRERWGDSFLTTIAKAMRV